MEKPWIIVQYDNRIIKDEYKSLISQNKAYCKKYGYDHILETKPYDLPPYWIKVRLVKDLLATNKYKGALWLDTDAVIHDHTLSIDELLIEGKSMYYCPDCPRWDQKFNAGVWIIKHDRHGQEILDKWMNSYNPTDWTKNGTKWTTSGTWAGSTYEQGAFTHYIYPQVEQHVHVYPWQILQSYEPGPNTFAMHFAGELTDIYLPKYKPRYTWMFILSILFFVFFCSMILYAIYSKVDILGIRSRPRRL
jgi:hypothetical protein